LFEPDRKNVIHLKANLLINDLLSSIELHEVAIGDTEGRGRLIPGAIDGGFSTLVAVNADDNAGYEVEIRPLDNLLALSDRTLAIKVDVERYECKVLIGMRRTLRQNRCVVQIEAFESRDQVVAMMTETGYDLVADYSPNFIFENVTTWRKQSK
jgi:FkbM family methyltransferase